MDVLNVLVESVILPHHLPFLWGQNEGVFQDHGFSVELRIPSEANGDLTDLEEGDVSFAVSATLSLIHEFLQGKSVVGVARFFESDSGVIYRTDAEIESPSDLDESHRAVANHIPASFASLLLEELIRNEGGSGTQSYPEIQQSTGSDPVSSFFGSGFELLVPGDIDPDGIRLRQQGLDVDAWFFEDFDFPPSGDRILVTSRRLVEEQPNLVRDFVGALHESLLSVVENTDRAVDLYRRTYPERFEERGITALLETSLPKLTAVFSQDVENYSAWGELLSQSERLGGFMDIDRMVDERFLPLDALNL